MILLVINAFMENKEQAHSVSLLIQTVKQQCQLKIKGTEVMRMFDCRAFVGPGEYIKKTVPSTPTPSF